MNTEYNPLRRVWLTTNTVSDQPAYLRDAKLFIPALEPPTNKTTSQQAWELLWLAALAYCALC